MTIEPPFAPVPDAVVTSEPVVAPASGEARVAERKPKGRKGLTIALILSLLAVVALGALSAYLWSVHSDYVAQNEELRETAAQLGEDLATSRALADSVQTQLDDTTAQLDEAKDTINGLANSEAQAGDDRLALIDVADGLKQCADARQGLIDHLNETGRWTPESLRASEASITEYCDKVVKAYNEIVND